MSTYITATGQELTGDGRFIRETPFRPVVKIPVTELERALQVVTGRTMRIMDMWTSDFGESAEFVIEP